MKYLSVCSGIEAATVAWHKLGWEPEAFSEIEAFPSAVLKHHYPEVPNLGDMTKYKEWNLGSIDILVGGTPCQSFSVAGLRKGLEDPRGNLALVYCGILDRFRPKWFVWENVPGVLSSGGGRDFGSFLGAVAELGYGFAYRVLDAQYYGVAQRRRRVFVVGYFGDWRPAAKVLFERESLRRDPPPSREERKVTPTLSASGTGVSRVGFNCEDKWFIPVHQTVAARMVAFGEYVDDGTASAMKARDYKDATDLVVQPIVIDRAAFNQGENAQYEPYIEQSEVMPSLVARGPHAVAQPMVLMDQGGSVMNVLTDGTVGTLRRETHGHEPAILAPQPIGLDEEQNAMINAFGTLKAREKGGGFEGSVMLPNMAVRRLTPMECERLQGFPDGYTDIKPKGKDTPDGPRYKALGNSMAVPVMGWIGKRIAELS